MSEDRTPRTISLTSHEEGEEPKRRPPRERRHHEDPAAAPVELRGDGLEHDEKEHLEDMDPRDRARMASR